MSTFWGYFLDFFGVEEQNESGAADAIELASSEEGSRMTIRDHDESLRASAPGLHAD